ncbi:MAG: hypothetical protein JWP89_2961 [Schlesneria sp.]|nr:hypothetical protein [Schlesneria sp.]
MFNIVNTVSRILRDLLNYQLAKWLPSTQGESFAKLVRPESPITKQHRVVGRDDKSDQTNHAVWADTFRATAETSL